MGYDPSETCPENLTQTAKNMLIFDNEKAAYLGNYLRRYYFREVGFVSETKNFTGKYVKIIYS